MTDCRINEQSVLKGRVLLDTGCSATIVSNRVARVKPTSSLRGNTSKLKNKYISNPNMRETSTSSSTTKYSKNYLSKINSSTAYSTYATIVDKTLKTNEGLVDELNNTFGCDPKENWDIMKDDMNGKIVKNVCISKEYQMYEPPKSSNKFSLIFMNSSLNSNISTTLVVNKLIVVKVMEVDEMKNRITVDVWMQSIWEDPRIKGTLFTGNYAISSNYTIPIKRLPPIYMKTIQI